MKTLFLIGLFLLTINLTYGQQTISLESCYENLKANYPLAKNQTIIAQQKEAELSVIKSKTLPQLYFNAQASYQSEVTQIPFPNSSIEPLNKDQYRATLTANQLIYNGGRIKATQNLQNITSDKKQQQVEVNLYQLKQKVNQLYFSVLLLDNQLKLLDLRNQQLHTKLKEIKSGIKNGVLLPTSDKVIEATLLKILQQKKEVINNKTKLIGSLSMLIGVAIDTQTKFKKPLISLVKDSALNRPELTLFTLQKQELTQQEQVLSKAKIPQIMGFATGGYGNPGLDMLKNEFSPYYIVGVKVNWNVFDWKENKKKREVLNLSKDLINNQEQVFKLNTNTALNEQQKEIETLQASVEIDTQLISLQKEVVATSDSQLKNGVITTSQYLTELTKLYEAENIFNQHKTQLQLAKANYNTLKGEIK
ncbi:TolC family protein [Tenacibaculum sp. UWU-22]|uniref:TolC family protein n=1 Tax=Tenacibaculum sp. UWU-22 TaxID=3234187 RepID=UPI0034DB1626